MVLLQDLEEKLKKESKKKHTNTPLVKTSAWFGIGVFVLGLAAIGYALAVYTSPKDEANKNNTTNGTNQPTSSIIPLDERARILQATLPEGSFAIIAAPDVKSGKSETVLTYDLRVVRNTGFTDDILLALENVPIGITASVSPEKITENERNASISVTIPKDAENGTYTINVVGSSGTKSASANVALAVSALELSNTSVTDLKRMDNATKWQATVRWTTNAKTNSWIEYAPENLFVNDLQYSFTAIDQDSTNEHALNLTFLEPNTVYHYRARSVDPQNITVVGDDQVLTTGE